MFDEGSRTYTIATTQGCTRRYWYVFAHWVRIGTLQGIHQEESYSFKLLGRANPMRNSLLYSCDGWM